MATANTIHDTIYALSSGALPAAIAIVRISGPDARSVFSLFQAAAPKPRRASVLRLSDPIDATMIDECLALYFDGPNTATGEDLVELHCHGSRAIVSRLFEIMAKEERLREAEPGEFTRRAFANGRIDLNQAEGLAELIEAEDERARRLAVAMYGGAFGKRIDQWRDTLLALSAMVEADLDFSDEDDVGEENVARLQIDVDALRREIESMLAGPSIEQVAHGVRVLIAGPPNSGKSSLLNSLVGRDAAIVSDIEGTTRDLIEVPVKIAGQTFLLTDSAGLRDHSEDAIEMIGIDRALKHAAVSDIMLWLGHEGAAPAHPVRIEIAAKADSASFIPKGAEAIRVSAHSGEGLSELKSALLAQAKTMLHVEDEFALNRRQHESLSELHDLLHAAAIDSNLLLIGERLRQCRVVLDRLSGRTSTEDMLDTLFGRFCIGK